MLNIDNNFESPFRHVVSFLGSSFIKSGVMSVFLRLICDCQIHLHFQEINNLFLYQIIYHLFSIVIAIK